MSREITRRRIARKIHVCPSCDRLIGRGEAYLVHTAFPGHDAGYADAVGHPVHIAECTGCATRYGRSGLLAGVSR
jgi:hypothetical protein